MGELRDLVAIGMDRRRRHERRKAAEQADIGEIPEVVHPLRRRACGESLHLFLATYFPDSTGASLFSDDHVRVIDRIEHGLRHGGRFCNAVYRGFAKTTITENAALWAGLYALRSFVAIYGADKVMAKALVASITTELCENDLLYEDFPEVCHAFRALDGRAQRGASQTHGGELTHIKMSGETLVFPTIWRDEQKRDCTPASGFIIRSRGITAAGRGMKYKRPDGVNVRPDFALLDDFQTDGSAHTPNQVNKRLDLIRKSILKSAGHNKTIACVANATVIADDDAVDQLLDPERNPAWDGERIKMVQQWADAHETLWQEYAKIRHGFDRSITGDQQRAARVATEFYQANREAMDAGCRVSWASCFDPETETSAIQHAYNLYIDDPPEVFASECQNEPVRDCPAGLEPIDALTVARKINGYQRREVPIDADHLTAAVDVHDDVLYWMLVAWRADCTGWVIDYGTWPDQRRAYFAKREATKTLRRKYPKIGREGAIVAGLADLVDQLCRREYLHSDGTPARIAKLLIDSGWAPDQVEHVCRTSPHAAVLQMTKGFGVGAAKAPMSEYKRKPGRTLGDNWYIEPRGRRLRILHPDTNHWKTWLHGRLTAAPTSAGSLTLFGAEKADHRLIGDHLTAERPEEVTSNTSGRTAIEWQPPRRDNHWLDCLVYCSVAASVLGCRVGATGPVESEGNRRRRAIDAAKKRGLM